MTDYKIEAIADGYVFECSCGELYNDLHAAWLCRKCPKYIGSPCSQVVNIETGETHTDDDHMNNTMEPGLSAWFNM